MSLLQMVRPRRVIPLLLALSAGTALFACNRHHHGHWGKACAEPDAHAEKRADKASQHLARKLDLNDSQRKEVAALMKSTLLEACELAPLRLEMGRTLVDDLRAEKADTAALESQIAKLESGLGAMKSSMLERYAKLHQVLTPEQRGKLATYLEKRMPKGK